MFVLMHNHAYVVLMQTLDALTTAQVAEVLHIDVRSVHRLVERETLTPTTKLPGRTGAFLFDRRAVDALATERAR